MIKRIWHGWTTPDNAAAYERLLITEVLPEIAAKNITGYTGVEVLQHKTDKEFEFVTIMTFQSLDNIIDFVGADIETAHVPASAKQLLCRFDARVKHYEARESLSY